MDGIVRGHSMMAKMDKQQAKHNKFNDDNAVF
jgi:hypothetical protein